MRLSLIPDPDVFRLVCRTTAVLYGNTWYLRELQTVLVLIAYQVYSSLILCIFCLVTARQQQPHSAVHYYTNRLQCRPDNNDDYQS